MHLKKILNLESSYNKYFLFILIIISFFMTLNVLPPLDRDESRYMQSTVQMLETGDFVNINFLNEPRLKKPPGIYWLQSIFAISVKSIISSTEIPIWAYRLPSAFGASISILVTFMIGRILYGEKVGYLASILLLGTPLLFAEAHLAKTDTVLLVCILIPLYAIAKIIVNIDRKETPSNILLFFGWFFLGISTLIKGPLGIFIVCLTIFSLKLSKIDFNFRLLQPAKGILFFLLGLLPCLFWIYHVDLNEVVTQSLYNDMFLKVISGQESHSAFPGFYILTSFLTCFPISLFFIPCFIWVYKNIRDRRIVFLLCWLIPSWIVFEFIPTKLIHYILPLLPSLAILSAAMIIDLGKNNFSYLNNNVYKFFAFLGCLLPIIMGLFFLYLGTVFVEKTILYTAIIVFINFLLFLVLLNYLYKKRYSLSAILSTVSNIISFSLFLIFVSPHMESLWVSEKIYNYINSHEIERPVILYGYAEPSIVFRLGSDTLIANNLDELILYLNNGKKNLVVIENRFEDVFLDKIKSLEQDFYRHNHEIKGINYSKGKKVLLSIYSN